MKYPPLNDSLPIPLSNGQRVSSFAKHCPACHTKVEAKNMQGLARQVDTRIILAAKAHCPQCQHHFNVACVIDEEKHVSRLWVPTGFLLWWLSGMEAPAPVSSPVEMPVVEINPEISTETLGVFDGKTIPAWIDWQGNRYRFERTDNGKALEKNEIRYNGLIFSRLMDTA